MNETINVKTYKLKSGEYFVISEVDYNNNHYVYLSNIEDENDLMLRRVKGDIVEPLDSKDEVLEVMKLIIK